MSALPSAQQPATPPPAGLIVGRVVDATTGAALPGVVVSITATQVPAANASRIAEPRALTDTRGRFFFRGVPAGSYQLLAAVGGTNAYSPNGFIVTGEGFPIGTYLSGGYGQRRANGPFQTIDVTENQRIGDVEIRLWKAGSISGRLLDEAGEPVVNQVVGAVQVAASGRLLTGPTVRTDDRGAYRLAALPPGSWIVFVPQTQVSMPVSIADELAAGPPDPIAGQRFSLANAPSPRTGGVRVGSSLISTTPDPARFTPEALISNALAPLRRGEAVFVYPTTFFPAAVRVAQATRITLTAGQDQPNTDVRLSPVATGAITGILTDDAGPMAGIGLHLMPADSGPDASVLEAAMTATDSRGAFAFPAVPAGTYTILAWRTGSVPTSDPKEPFADARRIGEMFGAWARQPVVVEAGRTAANVAVTLRAPVSVSGRVVYDGSAERLNPNNTRFSPAITIGSASPLFRTPGPFPLGRFDFAAGGPFTLKGVSPPGRFMLGFPGLPAPWTLQSVTVAGRDVTDAPFDVAGDDIEDLVVTFTDRPATISGTVALTTRDTSVSVFLFPAARARWPDSRLSRSSFRTVRAKSDGTFNFTAVTPGDYLVVAVADELAGDWPDETLLGKLSVPATTLRVSANQSITGVLKVSTIK